MAETITLTGLLSGLLAVAYGWYRVRQRRLVLDRLSAREAPVAEEVAVRRPRMRAFARRHFVLPWVLGIAVTAALYFGLKLHIMFAAMFGINVGLLGGLVDAMRVARISAVIETQLANSIDLMVAALHAGSSLPAAIENAMVESASPLKPELDEVQGRLRLGDEPLSVFRGLMQRVPLESFRLLAATLATHWEVGGSLAPTLATVGRTIRDRIEVSRRIRSLTAQSRVSTIAILAATYFTALVIWRNDPVRMASFLATNIGRTLVAGAVLLQAIGIVWSAQLGKVRY